MNYSPFIRNLLNITDNNRSSSNKLLTANTLPFSRTHRNTIFFTFCMLFLIYMKWLNCMHSCSVCPAVVSQSELILNRSYLPVLCNFFKVNKQKNTKAFIFIIIAIHLGSSLTFFSSHLLSRSLSRKV